MRPVLLLALLAVAADEPKRDSIVIRPKGAPPAQPPEPARPADDGAGRFLVIRPNGSGRSDTPAPRQLDTRPSSPRSAPVGRAPVPILAPKPVQDIPADKPADKGGLNGKLVLETWEAAYLRGMRVGYFRVTIREHEKDGKKFLHATKEQRMTVARFGQKVEMWGEDSTTETPDGQVLAVRMRQGLAKDQVLAVVGHADGGKLKVKGEGEAAAASNEIPWPDGVLGIAKEATLIRDKKPKPGDSFTYQMYEGRLNRVLTTTVTAKANELVALLEGEAPRRTLRLELQMETLKTPAGKVAFWMPPATMWVDADTYDPIRLDQDTPSFGGRLIILRTTREIAEKPVDKVPDLNATQSIVLAKRIPGVHELDAVTYRVTLSNDPNPLEAIPADARQAVVPVPGQEKTFDLTVTAVRRPGGKPDPKPGDEFLGTSFFLDWQDEGVRKHAATATAGLPAGATDWDKAVAIEKYVRRTMRAAEFSQALATAGQTAKALTGDCTEYAMLAAAMCRAVGVPSRTAIGLVHPDDGGTPVLAYHMWFEVYAGGRWLALDATLGKGSVGPGHIKITDASWHNERSFAPLLPVLQVLNAEPKVEVRAVGK